MDKKVIFDLEIYLEDKKYLHNYTVDVPEDNGLFHLLFITHMLEQVRAQIIEIDIASKEKAWGNDKNS